MSDLFAPMKFEHTELEELEGFVQDPEWVIEQKLDGTRALVKIDEHGILFLTHGGRKLTHTAATQHLGRIEADLAELVDMLNFDLAATWYLDGEIMIDTGVYYIFDAPVIQPMNGPGNSLRERRATLEGWMFAEGGPLSNREFVRLAPQARTADEKSALVERVVRAGGEGVMVKSLSSPYEQNQRVTHSLKVKFVKTADVIVTARDVGGKNAQFAVMGDEGGLIPVGGCSMIGKPDARPGDVIEVKYLYMAVGGALYQPRMIGIRSDKLPEECRMDQFASYSREVLV